MTKKVIIIGSGISGLSTAYFLNKKGVDVTVIDKSSLDESSSAGNAGFLSMFEKSPMSYPGVFADTLRAFIKRRTPMVINTVFDIELTRWGYQFYKASKRAKYNKTIAVLEHFGEEVFEFYDTITKQDNVDCEYERKGFALVYTEAKTYEKKLASIPQGSQHYTVLTREEIASNFPFAKANLVEGAIVLNRNGHLNPLRTIINLKNHLQDSGVSFIENEEIVDIEKSENKIISIKSKNNEYQADEFILATGSNLNIAKKISNKLIMTPGKGYSVTFKMPEELKPKLPALFCDVYTAVTPRREDVKITGKIEFGPSKSDTNERIQSILKTLNNYTKDFELKEKTVWSGDRPLTGDEMPYVGRDKDYSNFIYAMGMGHLGMSLGPISGGIICDLITKEQKNVDNTKLLLLSGFYQS